MRAGFELMGAEMKTEAKANASFLGSLLFVLGSIIVLAWGALLILPLYGASLVGRGIGSLRASTDAEGAGARDRRIAPSQGGSRMAT